ncbi:MULTISPECIES: hypothetical protein [Pseudomonas syringae group]|uniref:hypothetical protein n=1 Tax=Pseudomonas syringae group TaxID=136849 RepID=UPI0011C34A00|nr:MULTISPECIES: hypothetical protein [Pseudomonas syringae group]MCF5803543.1 hypothetical protein [Pseudomonas tremae]MCF5808137.1 hypothetical protein [Pseudomonas tremae]
MASLDRFSTDKFRPEIALFCLDTDFFPEQPPLPDQSAKFGLGIQTSGTPYFFDASSLSAYWRCVIYSRANKVPAQLHALHP